MGLKARPCGTVALYTLTPDRWIDLVQLFGANGACGGCWCMWFRKTSAEFERDHGDTNRRAFESLVRRGPPPGLLAYVNGDAAAWCAVSPRAELPRVLRSATTRPLDDLEPVWAVSCFFVHRDHRRSGLARRLLDGAVNIAARAGAAAVEGYPVDADRRAVTSSEAFHGTVRLFAAAGFRVVEPRRSDNRPVMRRAL